MLLGPGFAVGTLLWVIPTQILGSGFVTNISVFALLAILVIRYIFRKIRGLPTPSDSIDVATKLLATTTGLAFVVTSGEWPQFILAGVAFLTAGTSIQGSSSSTKFLRRTVPLLGIAAVILIWNSSRLRTYGWLITDDYSYLEALRVHLAEFGIWQKFGPTNISLYYWISPAWVGQVSQLTSAGDWLVITRIASFVFSISLASTTVSLVGRLSRTTTERVASILGIGSLCVIFFVTQIDFSGTSTFAVFAMASALVLFTLHAAEYSFPRRTWALIGLMAFGTFFTKMMAAPITFSLVAIIILYHTHICRRKQKLVLLSVIGVLAFAFVFFLELAARVLNSGDEFAWTVGVGRSEALTHLFHALAPHVFTIVLPSSLMFLAWGLGTRGEDVDALPVALSLTSLLFALLSFTAIVPGYAIDVGNYFAKPATYFALVAVTGSVLNLANSLAWSAAIGAFASVLVSPDLDVTARLNAWLKLLAGPRAGTVVIARDAVPILLGVVVSLGFTLLTHRVTLPIRRLGWRLLVTSILLTVILTFAVQNLIHRTDNAISEDSERWSGRSTSFVISVLGDLDQEVVGQWLRNNTARTAVFATNDLCDGNKDTELYDRSFNCLDPKNEHSLASISHRKFLVVGPRFHYQDPGLRNLYVNTSLRFGESFQASDRDLLTRLGARYFVFCRTCTRLNIQDKVMESSAAVFEYGRYVVLDLRK